MSERATAVQCLRRRNLFRGYFATSFHSLSPSLSFSPSLPLCFRNEVSMHAYKLHAISFLFSSTQRLRIVNFSLSRMPILLQRRILCSLSLCIVYEKERREDRIVCLWQIITRFTLSPSLNQFVLRLADLLPSRNPLWHSMLEVMARYICSSLNRIKGLGRERRKGKTESAPLPMLRNSVVASLLKDCPANIFLHSCSPCISLPERERDRRRRAVVRIACNVLFFR